MQKPNATQPGLAALSRNPTCFINIGLEMLGIAAFFQPTHDLRQTGIDDVIDGL